MSPPLDIAFDCLPLRSVGRLDVPLDAPPEYRELASRVKAAVQAHGLHNTYFLHRAHCTFHLTNDPAVGMLEFAFDGTALTDVDDRTTVSCDLDVRLVRETCDWLTEPVVAWFAQTVREAVRVEFNRFIAAGDLQRTIARMEQLRAESDAHGGFVGMGL